MPSYSKNDKVIITESMGKKTVCSVISSAGGFTVVRLPSGGAIRLRDSRLSPFVDETGAAGVGDIENPKAAGYRDPHDYMDSKSKYGP